MQHCGRYRAGHPDFTLPTYTGLIIPYAGMMDVPGNAVGIRHKPITYASNGIPALFMRQMDLRGPCWPERVMRLVRGNLIHQYPVS
jgi:hypothetical protein